MSGSAPLLLKWLEDTHPLSCSQSCSVLATLGDTVMNNLSEVCPCLLRICFDGLGIFNTGYKGSGAPFAAGSE